MLAINRVNRLGIPYKMTEVFGETATDIRTGDKHIKVMVSIRDLSQAWYNWQMLGQNIAKAFHMLDAGEREFLITGLTNEEFKTIFKDDEEEVGQ